MDSNPNRVTTDSNQIEFPRGDPGCAERRIDIDVKSGTEKAMAKWITGHGDDIGDTALANCSKCGSGALEFGTFAKRRYRYGRRKTLLG